MPTTQELFIAALELPLPERLRLAALLLDDTAHLVPLNPNYEQIPGYSSHWSEDDLRDLGAYAVQSLPVEPDWDAQEHGGATTDEQAAP